MPDSYRGQEESTLQSIDRRLTRIEGKVEGSLDHEARIRALEIAAARSAWVPVLVTSAITVTAATLVQKLIGA